MQFILVLVLALLTGCSIFGSNQPKANQRVRSGDPGTPEAPLSLGVRGGEIQDGVAPAKSGSAAYYAVWCGSYLDIGPASRAVAAMQKYGITAFTVKKTLVERRTPFDQPVGDFYLVLVGLFGDRADAGILASRLEAQGKIHNWQIIAADNPGELSLYQAQIMPLEQSSQRTQENVRERTGRPTDPSSPAATGEAFHKLVYGRYVGSFRDPLQARAEAQRLTSAGWPASVEEAADGGGMWYRVYLAPSANPANPQDMRADPTVLSSAKRQSTRHKGMVILVDSSGLKGVWGTAAPNQARTDASACAGYSQAGRLLTSIERLVSYIPDAGQLMMVKSLNYNPPDSFVDRMVRPVTNWWNEDDSNLAKSRAVFGPTIYNRPEVLRSLRSMKVDVRAAPLGPGLSNLPELNSIPGHKTVILYSDFTLARNPEDAISSVGQLKGQYGSDLNFIVVYGDTSADGLALANKLAQTGGSQTAWDGCLLLSDNSYFEKFVKKAIPAN
ncbi:MAG: SPOR domain-containing protein [Deltaproteobacteria bacterium]|nr:SPOR domain-containing protein [Deltaproteobacteria bacterium]